MAIPAFSYRRILNKGKAEVVLRIQTRLCTIRGWRMSTFKLHYGINDNKEGELSIDGFILSISRKPLANH
jgi:hypothetical protein